MARLRMQAITPGQPAKPPGMTKAAAHEWDRLIEGLAVSNITIAKAHGWLVEQAALIAVDIAEAAEHVKTNGPYYLNRSTGAQMLHPAARRLDSLRRDYVKVLSLLGLRSAVGGAPDLGKSLDDILDE